ncbi:transposase [Bradyrhizobium sp. 33ap4]
MSLAVTSRTKSAGPPGAVVSEIARRHGLPPQQVFTWRR